MCLMTVLDKIIESIHHSITQVYSINIDSDSISIAPTKKEFEGDYTYVVFPLVRELKQSPEAIANKLGEYLKTDSEWVDGFNVVKGFLNLELSNSFWNISFAAIAEESYATRKKQGKRMMVEFSSPNTNKPLHLGHIRNILLGWSISKIAENRGYEVIKTQVINDRGIAVCKSMMAWKLFADGASPESTGTKGDRFVGNYYVQYDKALQEEYHNWQADEGRKVFDIEAKEGESLELFFKRFKNQYFNEYSKLGKATKEMLLDWERGEEKTIALWKKMNGWVYEGFDRTYDLLGVGFDKVNYESETYLLGKETVQNGVEKGIFYKLDDGSIWIDLEDVGMDKKIVLRSDGTSVYITQDLGTAQMRYKEFGIDSMVYVVGDEQDYHFKVLFEILKRMNEPYADQLHHLSYGMVDLPSGKMKSREGTVVDADDLIMEVISEAKNSSLERGGVSHLEESQQEELFQMVGLAALKYFIIKVNPRKRMVFDPKESVDMQGTTGPYIQNAYVRIQSILRKAEKSGFTTLDDLEDIEPNAQEKELMVLMLGLPEILDDALQSYDPSVVANYSFALAKAFHRYYHENVIFDKDNPKRSSYRIELSKNLARILKKSMLLLGINMPEYM